MTNTNLFETVCKIYTSLYLNIATVLVTILFTSCEINYQEAIEKANPRLVPTYVCEGSSVPTTAVWTQPSGVRGMVEFRTKNGEKIGGRLGLRHEVCTFSRPLTRDDLPISVKLFHDGEEVGEEIVDYTVLSGIETVKFELGKLIEVDPKIGHTEYLQVPIFVRCEDAPNGQQANTEKECVDKIDNNGNPILDADGNVVQDCICPDEGTFLRMETLEVEVEAPTEQSINWAVDGTWFGDHVVTNSYLYKDGEGALTISGPGVINPQLSNVGSGGAGNMRSPIGVWTGTPPTSGQITTGTAVDEEGNRLPAANFILELTVSCTNSSH